MPKSKFAFSEGDLVKITLMPDNTDPMIGSVGYIEDVEGSRATLVIFDLDGNITEVLTLPKECLEHAPDDGKWKAARGKLDAYFDRIDEQGVQQKQAWEKRVSQVAKRFGLSPRKVQDIYDLLVDPNETGR